MLVGRTQPDEPVTALIGYHFLVPGLEKALDGHEKGDSFTVTLTPKDSYGEFDKTLVQEIDRRMFGDFPIEVGNVFEADSNSGPVASSSRRSRRTPWSSTATIRWPARP